MQVNIIYSLICGKINLVREVNMKNVGKYKVDASILVPIFIFFIISIISIYSTKRLLPSEFANLWTKQIILYIIGIILAYSTMSLGNKFFYQNAYLLYIIGIILLALVLPFGYTVNNATCWFKLPFIGTIQPSEFMKIFLIIILARLITDYNEDINNPTFIDEFKFLIKILIVIAIPSVLTFIEPDTGAVIMYLIITISMLFVGGLRKRWFAIAIIIITSLFLALISLYHFNQDLFIDIFGSSFFYRMDRITNWQSASGMQLENSMIAIGSANLYGHGIDKTPIYFPEMQNDFIFSVFSSNFGLIGSIILIVTIIYFDLTLISYHNKILNHGDKYLIGGIIGVLAFQQIYNISMTIGILPIMGITLPFISYGGSSLLSYMLLLGLIFNISNESLRYMN